MFKYYNFLNFKNNNKTYSSSKTKSNLIIESLEPQKNFITTETPTLTEEELFQKKFGYLEEQQQKTFLELNPTIDEKLRLSQFDNFLYHGIRFKNQLEKLEQILASGYLLAGNYQQNTSYYEYDDNCNGGEYISLATHDNDFNLCFETFVKPNLALIINPNCNAHETFYLNYDEWEKIKDINTKNRYSYVRGEYQVKEKISVDLVVAIGLPYSLFKLTNQESLIHTYLKTIIILLQKYNLNIPIVDHSNYNEILYMPISSNKDKYNNPNKRILKLK